MILSDAGIARIALGVIDRSLPKSCWTHAGHFAAALWFCRHRSDLVRPDAIRATISRYNEATGTANTDTGGYHHTITLASMGAAMHHLGRHPEDAPLHVVLSALMASEQGRPDWLLAYWSRDLLFGVPARRDWVDPDRAALPFRRVL